MAAAAGREAANLGLESGDVGAASRLVRDG